MKNSDYWKFCFSNGSTTQEWPVGADSGVGIYMHDSDWNTHGLRPFNTLALYESSSSEPDGRLSLEEVTPWQAT